MVSTSLAAMSFVQSLIRGRSTTLLQAHIMLSKTLGGECPGIVASLRLEEAVSVIGDSRPHLILSQRDVIAVQICYASLFCMSSRREVPVPLVRSRPLLLEKWARLNGRRSTCLQVRHPHAPDLLSCPVVNQSRSLRVSSMLFSTIYYLLGGQTLSIPHRRVDPAGGGTCNFVHSTGISQSGYIRLSKCKNSISSADEIYSVVSSAADCGRFGHPAVPVAFISHAKVSIAMGVSFIPTASTSAKSRTICLLLLLCCAVGQAFCDAAKEGAWRVMTYRSLVFSCLPRLACRF